MAKSQWVGVSPRGETMRGEMEAQTRQAMDELVQAGIKIVVDVTAGHVAAEVINPVLKPFWAVLKSFLPRFDQAHRSRPA